MSISTSDTVHTICLLFQDVHRREGLYEGIPVIRGEIVICYLFRVIDFLDLQMSYGAST